MKFENLSAVKSFKKLKDAPRTAHIGSLLTPERIEAYSCPAGAGLAYNYASKEVNDELLGIMQHLADEAGVISKFKAVVDGETMNTGENRKVLHHLLRGQLGADVLHGGKNLREFYAQQQERIASFAKRVHSGEIKGSTGKKFSSVVQIGIGGSDLGPRAMYLALKGYCAGAGIPQPMEAKFISNVDPDDAADVLGVADPEASLFILVSKSGTTQETLTNRQLVIDILNKAGINGFDPLKHMIAVTSETSPLAASSEYLDSFFIDDFIGGRYSSTSAVGGAVLSLAFGPEVFAGFLEGANEADALAMNEDIRKNAALLDALIGVYERNVLGYPSTAILPYSQALSRFPAHLQQLDMESNGKRVNRDGLPVDYATGPVIFGEPGTNGQHSFYQLLHQGTDIVPLQFIGFKENQAGVDTVTDGSTSQEKLNANLTAQIVAFALGKDDANPNKQFPGKRPSSLIYGDKLTPKTLGALLAHFENKVMFQGFLWNLNSFDQEGVQLGKVLAKTVLAKGDMEPALRSYGSLLGVL